MVKPASAGGNVPVRNIDFGNHGDHWRAFFGFGTPDEKILRLVRALREEHGRQIGQYATHDLLRDGLGARLITDERQYGHAGFPLLHSDLTLPFEQRTILEWSHVRGIEAQIEGGGRGTFALRFFATDYLEKKDAYRAHPRIDVRLSAFAFALVEYTSDELRSGGYFPNQQFKAGDVFDFAGARVLDVRPFAALDTQGHILRLRILENDDGQEHWSWDLDLFVHSTSTSIENFQKGMRVAGCFWLQGCLNRDSGQDLV